MRHLTRTLVAVPAVALALAAPTAAFASPSTNANLVDGTVVTGDTTCGWTDATTSANPPDAATVDGSTVAIACDSDTSLALNNDPTFTFDDTAGTATVDTIDVSGTMLGITCRYEANGIVLNRDGDTRTYAGGPYTGDLVDGGILCPSTIDLDQATVTFH